MMQPEDRIEGCDCWFFHVATIDSTNPVVNVADVPNQFYHQKRKEAALTCVCLRLKDSQGEVAAST